MTAAQHLDPDASVWDWIAVDLRMFREIYNMRQTEVARILGVVNTTVSNLEAGRTKLRAEHAEILDTRWRTRGHFQRLVRLANSMHDPNWFAKYTRYEINARHIRTYQALVVPGLLQTPEYAYALLAGAGIVEDPEASMRSRMARQEILDGPDAPQFWVLIKQSALEDPIGGAEVMRSQLAHLLEVSERRNVVLRVVPRSTGAHVGVDGSFSILTGPRSECAYMEAVGGGRLVLDPEKIENFRMRFDKIGADALSRDATRRLIRELMEAMR
ncbi:helix-turn-helix domain-containing protein [Actinomadura harenae]|uniref:XRE family transcriptional regulator n=1 Tax=Actinomadura harenae TaxID=2483351 RepID=A0A3M2LTD7_9ACTN|nr:helix-turn-helix transcriptional regulator [Actinomadura harenae]RMI40502.1 XRE family transcriptional regulator [Actinomadura harenae]